MECRHQSVLCSADRVESEQEVVAPQLSSWVLDCGRYASFNLVTCGEIGSDHIKKIVETNRQPSFRYIKADTKTGSHELHEAHSNEMSNQIST